MKKIQTTKDLEMLEQGVIPESMEWRLPESGVVFFEPEKLNYNINTFDYWMQKWDSCLLEEFPCLIDYATKIASAAVSSGRTPLDEITEKQNISNDIIHEDGITFSITEKTEAYDVIHSA